MDRANSARRVRRSGDYLHGWACLGWLRQAGIMKTQAAIQESTLTATKTAAEAAKKSADVAEKSVNSIERPHILIGNIKSEVTKYLADNLESPGTPRLIFSLKNYGRSPAFILEVKGLLELVSGTANVPVMPAFSPPALPLDNIVVIGPSISRDRTVSFSNPVDDSLKRQIQNENEPTRFFWFFVSICYEDMLGTEHETKMRFRYLPKTDNWSMVQGDDYTIRT